MFSDSTVAMYSATQTGQVSSGKLPLHTSSSVCHACHACHAVEAFYIAAKCPGCVWTTDALLDLHVKDCECHVERGTHPIQRVLALLA